MEPWLEEHIRVMQEGAVREAEKYRVINENLPSWSQVETALDNISTLAEAKAALKKIARVVYWLAKNKGE